MASLGSNGLALLAISLVIVGLPELLTLWGQNRWAGADIGFAPVVTGVGGWFLSLITSTIMQGLVTETVVADLQRRKPTLSDSLEAAVRVFLPLLGVGIITGLAAFLGLILLIVPGVLIFLAWFVAGPVVVAERTGVSDAISRSLFLTRNHRLWILLLTVVYFVTSVIFGMLAGLIGAIAGGVGVMLTSAAVSAISTLAWSAVVASFYVEMRVVKEGGDRDDLASIFE